MSTINDSDLLLVERNGNLHQITYDQMSTLNDDDILLVERGGVQYKVEAQYISTGANGLIVPPVEVLTPINGAGITEFDQYEPLSSAITAVGETGTIAKDTDEIQSVAVVGTQPAEVYYMTSAPTNLADVLANGVPYVDGQSLAAGSKIVFVRTATSTGQVFSSNGTTGFIMIGDGAGFYSADGTRLGGGGSYNSGEYTLFNYDDEDPSTASPIYKIQTHSSVAYTVMATSSGTGPTLNAAAITTLKSLSFPTNTNFNGLSVGDVVQGGTLESPVMIATNTPGETDFVIENFEPVDVTSTNSQIPSTFDHPTKYRQLCFYLSDPTSDVELTMGGSGWNTYSSVDGVNWVQGTTHGGGAAMARTLSSNNPSAKYFLIGALTPGYPYSDWAQYKLQSSFVNNWNPPYTIEMPVGGSITPAVEITAIDASGPSQTDVYATFDPDSFNANQGTMSNGNLTLNASGAYYIEGRSTLEVFSGDNYSELTVTSASGSDSFAFGIGDADAWIISGVGSYFIYRENGAIISYPGNTTVATVASYTQGDVLGMAVDSTNVKFYKNGALQGTYAHGKSGTFYVYSMNVPNVGSAQLDINFGATAFTHTAPSGYVGLSETVTTYPNVTVSGGDWDTSNQSQVWSNGLTTPSNSFNGGQPATDAFDGDLSTFAGAGSIGEDIVFQPTTPISYTDSIEVYTAQAGQMILNSDSPVATTDATGWVTLVSGSSGSINTITIDPNSNRRATLHAIRVDGQLLVDAIEDSQVWSADGTGTPYSASYNWDKAFNGLITTNADTAVFASTSQTMTWTPSTPITVNTELILYLYLDSGLQINGQYVTPSNSIAGGQYGEPHIYTAASIGGTLSSISITTSSSNVGPYLTGVEVDGKLLVDSGVRDFGDKKLTSSIPYEKSLTFTDTTELANMVAPLEMADATGGNSLTPTTSNVVSSSFTPASSFFNTTLYTGNASGAVQTFNTGLDMQNNGGMIWFKSRTSSQAARIIDTYRGTRPSLLPHSHILNNALGADGLTFLDDGFSIGWEGNDIAGANDYVAWSFREAAGFFDIVTWAGNGSSTREISHNLGSTPGFIILKKYAGDSNRDWWCWHKSISTGDLSSNDLLRLNATNGIGGTSAIIGSASSTMFEIAGDDNANGSGQNYIAYVFADNPSKQIKCGSYLGNATGGGDPAVPNQIECGFRPKFVLIKNAGNDTDWLMFDDQRGDKWIKANSSDSEGFANPAAVVFNDTGFSLPTGLHWVNQDNTEHIFMAIGEAGDPDQTEITFQDNTALSALTSGMTIASNGGLLSVPTFSVDTYSGNDSVQSIDNGIDLAGEGGLTWIKYRDGAFGNGHYLYDTERGSALLQSNLSDQQYSPDNRLNFDSSGFNVTINGGQAVNANDYPYVAWSFRKAPGFFDIQTYTGNGDGNGITDLPHQLGSEPGMIIIKRTSAAGGWYVYHKGVTSVNGSSNTPNPAINNYLLLDSNIDAQAFGGGSWASTSTTFSAPFGINSNFANHEYVAYLFADNPSNGIKCGSYTGTGADNNDIECGFEPTWVMIKNVDESGGSNNNKSDWYISDHKRGFSSHYGSMTGKSLSANTNAGDKSDATIVVSATGFKPATGGEEYNKLGVEYIYMAIGSPTAPGGPAIGTLITDADPSTNKVSVDTTSWPTDYTVTGPSLGASLTSILEVSGNTIFGNGSTGTWMPGYYAEGSQINAAPPGPSEITFTSQNQGTPTFSGVDATLTSRTWTLESGPSATGPWTVVDTYEDYDALNSQDGATPWTSNKPTLQPNTYYRIKVQYNSTNAESIESVYNTFKTGDA